MVPFLKERDKVGLIACSDGRYLDNQPNIKQLINILNDLNLNVTLANTIYQQVHSPFSGTPEERAQELMKLYVNPDVKAIFDISGGDSANQILPYLNFELIQVNPKPFVGISDLSVLLNAIHQKTGHQTIHYQLYNLIEQNAKDQLSIFKKLFFEVESSDYKSFDYDFIRGNEMSGIIIGGNIRCFLKLAGTSYLPNPRDKILFLESLGGGPTTMSSLLAQLDQIGYYKTCNGILLGTFTQMENRALKPSIEELVLDITNPYQIPIVKSKQLGHGYDAHGIIIGKAISLK